ncbi:MAG: nucleotidyltransferase domain-containing protein [Bacteroidaceae bacterium]|nr:nucleotidyltransferase domain-containing protein [Bacteroidaceae bacterium]
MNQIITDSFDKIEALCKRHSVQSLSVFGSVLTPQFNPDSDIDFLVHFNTDGIADYVTNYFSLKHSLESELGRPVDLVEDKSIRNPIFRRNIDKTKVPLYG